MTYRPTDRFENWFITSLQTAVNDTTSSFRLNDNLNIQKCRLVIDPHDESVREVVKVTSVDGNLVYVERGDDNTPANYHLEGAVVALNVVAGDMNDLYEDFAGVVDATDAANQAASDAAQAAIDANQATTDANNAAGAATTATGNANSATSAANSAAGSANSAASSANTAAGNAQDAADNAQGIVDDVAGAVDDGILPIHTDKVNNRVGIDKVPTQGALDVDGDIYSNGRKVSITPGFTTFNCRQSAVQSNTSTVNPKIITDTYNTHSNGGSGEISVSGNRPIKIDVSAPLYTNGSGNADLHVRIDGTDYFITTSNNATSGGSCPMLSGSRILPAGTIDEGTYTCYMTYVGNTNTTNVSNYKEATCTIYEI